MTAVSGDPAAMRAAAAQLRYRAESLANLAAQADSGMVGMTFAGPAADRWRSEISGHAQATRAVSARMQAVADTLLRAAAAVEEQLRLLALQGRA